MTILRVRKEALSITAGRRPPGDNDTWWWNDMVQDMMTAKRERGKEDVGNIRKARGQS